jgi:hypothetical protein
MAMRTAVVVMILCGLVEPILRADGRQVGSRVQVPSGILRTVVTKAVRGAAVRLASPRCLEVFVHFTDETGRTLRENLQRLERSPVQFLSELWFVDAGNERTCRLNEIAAYTTPGTRVVYVCSTRFASPIHSLLGVSGEFAIIHEMLHALGLGEGGRHPTSREISRKVAQSCG